MSFLKHSKVKVKVQTNKVCYTYIRLVLRCLSSKKKERIAPFYSSVTTGILFPKLIRKWEKAKTSSHFFFLCYYDCLLDGNNCYTCNRRTCLADADSLSNLYAASYKIVGN